MPVMRKTFLCHDVQMSDVVCWGSEQVHIWYAKKWFSRCFGSKNDIIPHMCYVNLVSDQSYVIYDGPVLHLQDH